MQLSGSCLFRPCKLAHSLHSVGSCLFPDISTFLLSLVRKSALPRQRISLKSRRRPWKLIAKVCSICMLSCKHSSKSCVCSNVCLLKQWNRYQLTYSLSRMAQCHGTQPYLGFLQPLETSWSIGRTRRHMHSRNWPPYSWHRSGEANARSQAFVLHERSPKRSI